MKATGTTKICPKCGQAKNVSDFCRHKTKSDGLNCWCKLCCNQQSRLYYEKNFPLLAKKRKPQSKESFKSRKDREWSYKKKFLDMYGHRCACPNCSENRDICLTLDHVVPLRSSKRGKNNTYRYLLAADEYRPDLYQVLCYTCNQLKGTRNQCSCGPKTSTFTEDPKPWMLL